MGIGRNVVDLLAEHSNIQSVLLDTVLEEKAEFFENVLNSPISDVANGRVKKLMAAALHIAASKGHDIGVAAQPSAIAPLVDEVYSRLKFGVFVEAGKMKVYEAADALIDKAAARLIVLTETVIAKGIPLVAQKLVDAIAVYYPPIEVVAPFIKNLAQRLTPICQEKAKKGIRFLSTFAKGAVRTVVGKTETIIKRTIAKAKVLFA